MICFKKLFPKIVLIVLLVLTSTLCILSTVKAEETIIIQPGPAAGKDARIHFPGSLNFGSEESSPVNIMTRPKTKENRLLIQFDLLPIPANSRIISASLQLYGTGSGTIRVLKITNSWEENTVNWSICGIDYPDEIASASVVNNGFTSWNVTDFVKNVLAGTYNNYGFSLYANSASDSANFYTSDNSAQSNRPKLIVTYKESGEVISTVTNVKSGTVLDYTGKNLIIADGGNIKVGSGKIIIKADNLIIESGGKITANGGSKKKAGTIVIKVAKDITISGKILAKGKKGGKITLKSTAGKILVSNSNAVVNSSGNKEGGKIKLVASDAINISGKIKASGKDKKSKGGKIEMHSKQNGIAIKSTAKIKAVGKKHNGKIKLTAKTTVTIEDGAVIKPKPKIKEGK